MKENLPELLDEFIKEKSALPFVWGENDCCLFSADWVLAVTGIDPAAEFRGKYKTSFGAARTLLPYGGVEGIVNACPQIESIPTGFAGRGAIVAASIGERGEIGVGVCLGRVCAFAGLTEVQYIPTSKIKLSWRIK